VAARLESNGRRLDGLDLVRLQTYAERMGLEIGALGLGESAATG
jgi:hypothetical protein